MEGGRADDGQSCEGQGGGRYKLLLRVCDGVSARQVKDWACFCPRRRSCFGVRRGRCCSYYFVVLFLPGGCNSILVVVAGCCCYAAVLPGYYILCYCSARLLLLPC